LRGEALKGVYVGNLNGYSGSIDKTGGTIYGYNEGDTVNSNAVKNSSGTVVHNQGHAVYAERNTTIKRKEITAGPGVNLSNYDSGGWDY